MTLESGPEETTINPDKEKQLQDNIRHISQLAMGWFAFFVTVNYAAMAFATPHANKWSIRVLGAVFVIQNSLGMFGIAWVLVAIRTMARKISGQDINGALTRSFPWRGLFCRKKFFEASTSQNIPVPLYDAIGNFLILVLGSLILAWVVIVATLPVVALPEGNKNSSTQTR